MRINIFKTNKSGIYPLGITNFDYIQKENLTQYLGGAPQNQNELLSQAHYDNEVSLIILLYLVLHTS